MSFFVIKNAVRHKNEAKYANLHKNIDIMILEGYYGKYKQGKYYFYVL